MDIYRQADMKETLPKIQSTCFWGNEYQDRWTSQGWWLLVQSTSFGRQSQQSSPGENFPESQGPYLTKILGALNQSAVGNGGVGRGPSKGERKRKPQANLVSFVIFQEWVWINEKSSWKFPFLFSLLFFGCVAYGILVPQQEIEPTSPALEMES